MSGKKEEVKESVDTENEWITGQYRTTKKCIGGLVIASISWAMTGEHGYILNINQIAFKKHFKSIDDAKRVADKFIAKKVEEYLRLKDKIEEVNE